MAKAKNYALKTIATGEHVKDSYTLIGDLYLYNSYDKCKTSDVVVSRGVYLAAYDMYVKAGNTAKMEASKKQFPSDQEVFFTNRKVGEKLQVGCWINQEVEIRKR